MIIYYRNRIDKIIHERIEKEKQLIEKLLSLGEKGD